MQLQWLFDGTSILFRLLRSLAHRILRTRTTRWWPPKSETGQNSATCGQRFASDDRTTSCRLLSFILLACASVHHVRFWCFRFFFLGRIPLASPVRFTDASFPVSARSASIHSFSGTLLNMLRLCVFPRIMQTWTPSPVAVNLTSTSSAVLFVCPLLDGHSSCCACVFCVPRDKRGGTD